MNKANNSQSNTLLDDLLNVLTDSPRNFLLFVLIMMGLIFSVETVCMGIILSIPIRFFRRSWLWVGLLGALFVAIIWLADGITAQVVHDQSTFVVKRLIYGDYDKSDSIYVILCALPYSLLWGGLAGGLLQFKGGLESEVKRVARGKLQKEERGVSKRRIDNALAALPHSAYASGSVLGVDRRTSNYATLDDKDANLHTLAIGTTGSGKTTSLGNIIESVILRELPLFFIDGKGDLTLAHRIQRFAQENNRPFYLFSMVGPSFKYNPISFGGYTSKKDRIIELRHWSEDHYRKIAEGYLQTVFKVLSEAKISTDLHSLVKYLDPKKLHTLANNLKEPSLMEASESLKTQYADVSSLIAEIKNLVNSEVGHLFDCSAGEVITLERILEENAVGYFCLQPLAYPAYAELLGKLVINDFKALVAAQFQKTQKPKIYAIFDEFSVFAGEQVMTLMNQGRGAGVHAILSSQSLSDLLQKGGDALLGQLLNNINNYIIQRQNNPDDAEILANIIGTKDDFQVTSQVSAERSSSSTGSVRLIKEFIVHPDRIKRLDLGEAILVNKQRFKVQRVILRKGKI